MRHIEVKLLYQLLEWSDHKLFSRAASNEGSNLSSHYFICYAAWLWTGKLVTLFSPPLPSLFFLPHPNTPSFSHPPCFDYYWKSRNQPLDKNSRSQLHFPNCTDDLKSEFSYTSTHFMVLIRRTSVDNFDIRLMLWCKLKTSANPGRIWFFIWSKRAISSWHSFHFR